MADTKGIEKNRAYCLIQDKATFPQLMKHEIAAYLLTKPDAYSLHAQYLSVK
jgi:hypothetical protein